MPCLMKNKISACRRYLGAIVLDAPTYIRRLLLNFGKIPVPWTLICNRGEQLTLNPDGIGVVCNWRWTSDLYLPKVFPIFGKWLFKSAFSTYPYRFSKQDDLAIPAKPDISFLIGHRGLERLPLLMKTIESLAGQEDCSVECIVVEQDTVSRIEDQLPKWVKYVFLADKNKKSAYCRSRLFNVAAKLARSEFYVFHDNDMVVPACYAKEILSHYRKGFDVVNLKRFIFYFNLESSKMFLAASELTDSRGITAILQNAEGGGSLGVSSFGFNAIGGFDERFVGWGGEDNEFWERASTLNVYNFSYLPLIHLWHPPQKEKYKSNALGVELYNSLSRISPERRIEELRNSK